MSATDRSAAPGPPSGEGIAQEPAKARHADLDLRVLDRSPLAHLQRGADLERYRPRVLLVHRPVGRGGHGAAGIDLERAQVNLLRRLAVRGKEACSETDRPGVAGDQTGLLQELGPRPGVDAAHPPVSRL